MRNPIRFQNVLVGAIVIYIVFRAWWNGFFNGFLLANGYCGFDGESSVSMTGLGNSVFGALLFIALDAVDFVGKLTITAVKFIYALIRDVVMGTKSLSDLLKQQEEPVPVQLTSVAVEAPPKQEEKEKTSTKKQYTDREILVATFNNTKVLNESIKTVSDDLNEVKSRVQVLEEAR